jgi:toxin HigB-1
VSSSCLQVTVKGSKLPNLVATRYVTGYNSIVIKDFKHKGLEKFFLTGSKAGIRAAHVKRLRLILGRLNASTSPRDMNLPGLYLHELTGNRQGTWSVRVSGNWRVTFQFDGADAIKVNYEDYH